MKRIIGYLKSYAGHLHPLRFAIATIFIAFLIFCNYRFQLNNHINVQPIGLRYLGWMMVFLLAFTVGYLLSSKHKIPFGNRRFLFFLFLGPALFAWKMTGWVRLPFSEDAMTNEYWNLVLYWPIKLLIMLLALYLVWKYYDSKNQPFYGFSTQPYHWKPYLLMLLLMVPLIAAAATQPDFLHMYPKLQHIQYLPQAQDWKYKLLFEFCYGLDFVSIEVFFRGFLVLAFCKWAGRDAILPMALFYCTIHFGKPLGECISSYFGGLILGVVTYHTGAIYGGLMVHLGIAWLMELGGYIGNLNVMSN